MSDPTLEPGDDVAPLSSDLTQTIRKLSLPIDTVDDLFEEPGGTAVLLSKDKDARKWAPRWLNQAGLQTAVASDPSNAVQIVKQSCPDIVLIDAALAGPGSQPAYQALIDDPAVKAMVIVLCNGSREVATALDSGAFDVARKPVDWRAISHRTRHALAAVNQQSTLNATNEALQEALAVANTARKRLRSHESFEPVTGLPNRSKFVDLLRRAMHVVDRDSGNLVVIVIGFTRFRLVIEAMGQEHADRVLGEIGHRIGDCVRESPDARQASYGAFRTAAIAALDPFRFGVLLTGAHDDETVATLHNQLLSSLATPIHVAGQTVHLSACLGVALYPRDATDVDSLLQRADNAMRDAQSRGGGFKYYCSETDAAAARKLRIEHMLHEALDRGELSLAYQPIVDVSTGAVSAAEALLRWCQPDGTVVNPEEFVAVAEESGLMVRTGMFALDLACRQLAEWQSRSDDLDTICVNVSKVQLMSVNFAQSVADTVDKYGIDPGNLELEISERGVLSGDYEVIEQLHALKKLGVKLSVDDFGTGNSAIAYLKDMPIDTLKIDRSYVAGMVENPKDAAIASAMVALGQRMNLNVIAEGVETEAQLEMLRSWGSQECQGFLFSPAVPAEDFLDKFG